jgi:hypothetical protein
LQELEALWEEYSQEAERFKELHPYADAPSIPMVDYVDMMSDSAKLESLYRRIDELEKSLLPSKSNIAKLPRFSKVAFAARCARRMLQIAEDYCQIDVLREGIHAIEETAHTGHIPADLEHFAEAIRERLQELHVPIMLGTGTNPRNAYADALSRAIVDALNATRLLNTGDDTKSLPLIANIIRVLPHPGGREASADFALLLRLAKKHGWNDETVFPRETWALHSRFDLDREIAGRTIIEVSSFIDAQLMDYFQRDPEKLYDLSPRQFEKFIAELFDGFGFYVELTAHTKDGGRDIVALGHSIAHVKYLVECKRYAKERPVGLAPVQRLFGVVASEGATKGILATTAKRFSRPAQLFFSQHPWVIEGRAFDGLLEWLESYQQIKTSHLLTSQ